MEIFQTVIPDCLAISNFISFSKLSAKQTNRIGFHGLHRHGVSIKMKTVLFVCELVARFWGVHSIFELVFQTMYIYWHLYVICRSIRGNSFRYKIYLEKKTRSENSLLFSIAVCALIQWDIDFSLWYVYLPYHSYDQCLIPRRKENNSNGESTRLFTSFLFYLGLVK